MDGPVKPGHDGMGNKRVQKRDAALEDWLIRQVVPVYDAMKADPGRGKTPEQVAEHLRAHYAARLENTSHGA